MDTIGLDAEQWSTVAFAHPVAVEDDGRISISAVEVEGRRMQPDKEEHLKTSARLLNERRPAGYLLPLSSSAGANPRGFSHLLRVEAPDWSAPREWVVVFA